MYLIAASETSHYTGALLIVPYLPPPFPGLAWITLSSFEMRHFAVQENCIEKSLEQWDLTMNASVQKFIPCLVNATCITRIWLAISHSQ